ncbi:hypothetical protein Daqu01_02685 [Deinococcus aquaticus]
MKIARLDSWNLNRYSQGMTTNTNSLHQRPLGRSGLSVSEIGYGAWGIGADMWKGAQDDESLTALRRYVALGGNFIDTKCR